MSPRRSAGAPAARAAAGVLLSREVPKNCLPGGDWVPDELGLRELCVQSLSACLGVRLCRSSHQTLRTTNIGGDDALVQTCTRIVMVYKWLTISTVTVAVFQKGSIHQRLRPAHTQSFVRNAGHTCALLPVTMKFALALLTTLWWH